jgi:hypothetical protein
MEVRLRLVRLGKSLPGLYAGNPNRKIQQPTTDRLLKAFASITLTQVTAADAAPIAVLQAVGILKVHLLAVGN